MQQQAPAAGGLLGTLSAGDGKLQGKSFYLDSVKARSVTLLVEAISLLGGKVESFLHKDVSFVVTGNQEGLKEKRCVINKAGSKGMNGDVCRSLQRENVPSSTSSHAQRPGTPRPPPCGSRGKALLEKAIRNNGQATSVLANARSWGVKILFVDDVLLYLQRLSRDSFNTKHKGPEQKKSTNARVIKAVSLRSPYLKVEDLSRKFKPLLMQSMTMPTLYYGGRFSPFEPPPPPRPEGMTKEKRRDKPRDGGKATRSSQNKPQSTTGLSPLHRQTRKKDIGYCECCHLPYVNQEQHLQSDEHRSFVLDASNYVEMNQLVADMHPGFSLNPPQQTQQAVQTRLPTPPPIRVPSPAELKLLTDLETEQALQTLLTQVQAPSPHTKPLSSSPAGPTPVLPNADCQPHHHLTVSPTISRLGSQPSHPSPTTPRQGSQPSHTSPTVGLGSPRSFNTDENSQPSHPSPTTPLLDSQSDGPCSDVLRSDPPLLTPYSDSLMPPVLSPQVPDDLLEPHSPYSQPPFLCPQVQLRPHSPYLPEEIDMENLCPEFVPGQSNGEGQPLWFNRPMHPNSSDERPGQAACRSRSLPRLSTAAPNGEKRCCSASPERNPRKRMRVSLTSSQRLQPIFCPITYSKPEDKVMPVVEDDLLMDTPANHTSISSAGYSIPSVEHVYFNIDHQQNLDLGEAHVPKSTLQFMQTDSADKLRMSQLTLTTSLVPSLQNLPQWLGHKVSDISDLRCTSVKPTCMETPTRTEALTVTARMPDPTLYSLCDKSHCPASSEESHSSRSWSLAPEMAALSPSSSDSDWDCELLARLNPNTQTSLHPAGVSCGLDQELLHRPCTGMNSNYESRLHSALQSPPTPPASFCGEETDKSAFSRTVMQVVEVQRDSVLWRFQVLHDELKD